MHESGYSNESFEKKETKWKRNAIANRGMSL